MNFDIKNPAFPAQSVASFPATPIESIDEVMQRAKSAQRVWAAVPAIQRGEILNQFIDAIIEQKDRIAKIITSEQGKPLAEALGEVSKSAMECRAVISRVYKPIGEVLPPTRPGLTSYSVRRPRGVALGICPWNFPINTPLRKTIPALVYGNSIVLKPSELTPGATLAIHEIAQQFLPQDVFQVVVGGAEFSAALVAHSIPDAISFTGSVATGKSIAASAAANLAEISLELGGKNPVILDSAHNLDNAVEQIYRSAMLNAGQRCTSISRVLVHKDLENQVLDKLVARAASEKLGSGLDAGTTMGPLVSRAQFDRVRGFVERAIAQGAILSAGELPTLDTPEAGYFFPPTIVSNVSPTMEIAKEEVFGPVLSVLRYDTIDEAIKIANDIEYGLTSSIFSTDSVVIDRFISESQSGMIHVNNGTFPDEHLPFVGTKASSLGVGGSNGASLEQFYTSEHAVYLQGGS